MLSYARLTTTRPCELEARAKFALKSGHRLRNSAEVKKLVTADEFADTDDLLLLLAKGRAFFRGLKVDAQASCSSLTQACIASGELPADIARQLQEFAGKFLSSNQAGELQLKSLIRTFAHVPRHGRCCSNRKSCRRCTACDRRSSRRCPASSRWTRPPSAGSWKLGSRPYSTLHRLFNRTVFQTFRFVRAAQRSTLRSSSASSSPVPS